MIETEIINLLLLVALALLSARLLGYIFFKLKQPAVVGEILAGIILGALGVIAFSGSLFSFNFSFNLSFLDYTNSEFRLFAEIGIIFVLFLSGLQTSIKKFKKMGKTSLFIAIGGALLPLVFGFLISLLFFPLRDSIVMGLILTATSVGVTIRALMDIHKLDTDVGTSILGGAVIDDVIGIILLAFALGIHSIYDAVWIVVRIALFFFVFLYIGLLLIDKILDIGEKIHLPKAFLSISLAILLLYAYFADKAGIAGIIGAFVAGLLIGQTVKSRKIEGDVEAIGYGFFIPLFFVWVGATLWDGIYSDASSLSSIIIPAIAIIFIAIIGKIVGCGIGAKIGNMNWKESLQIGVGMIPRLEISLIIMSAAIYRGVLSSETIENQLLTITVLLTIVTTIITPLLIKITFKNEEL